MKKFLLLLGMVTCLIGTAACGKADQVQESQLQIDEASLINYSDQVVNALNEIVTGGMQDQYASDAVISAGISSWESAMSDLGAYNGVTDHKVEIGSDEAIVEASVSGADHNAVVTLIINDQGSLSSITVNVERSMGELMLNAALNTLMGMGTVFIILILISLLIGCFKFIPQIFLTADELKEIRSVEEMDKDITTDTSLITIQAGEAAQTDDGKDAYGLVDDDGDGIIFTDIKGNGFVGYMITVLDPSRVFVGMPDSYGGVGLTLQELVNKYGAEGGINAGGFKDDGGGGFGGIPEGITVINGEIYNGGDGSLNGFAGFDKEGILHVGYFEYDDIIATGIVNGVSFGPILISNGEPTPSEYLTSGVNPRTAIAQRADGAVIMLVIDGRQLHSIGAKYQDVIDILMDYGAVNACNMDGGSSTVMYYEGQYVNSCSAENGQPRPLPDAFMFK